MAWLGKVSLGGFPDLAGAVTKLSESVKNIEKNFDSALGLEEKPDSGGGEASGIWPSVSDRKTLFDPVMAFMGHRDGNAADAVGKTESPEHPLSTEGHDAAEASSTIENAPLEKESEHPENVEKDISDSPLEESRDKDSGDSPADDHISNVPREPDEAKDEGEPTASLEFNKGTEQTEPNVSRELDEGKDTVESNNVQATTGSSHTGDTNRADSVLSFRQTEGAELETNDERQSRNSEPASSHGEEQTEKNNLDVPDELHHISDVLPSHDKVDREAENLPAKGSPMHIDVLEGTQESGQVIEAESSVAIPTDTLKDERTGEVSDENLSNLISAGEVLARDSDSVSHDILASSKSVDSHGKDFEHGHKEQPVILTTNMSDSVGPAIDVEKMKKEMKLMEAALQGAARQAQSKADEIARLMNENEKLKSSMEDLKRKSADAEVDALREEYHQRVAALERKVYRLSRERDALRREQSKKSDAALLLKEKDEIISQVMAEGEELSKKQAAQESTIRKLRAQIREFEEEKQRLNSKLQAEETKVESIRKDKAATEKLLQETIERNQAELAAQKEFYTNALNAVKEAEALAEARANNEARIELESRLREAGEREAMLVQTLDELRQTLSRTEQQAVFREDMLRRDINDLQNRYQASELRYNELITQVPDSTRPLLRQIEAMQETAARREEAWAGVERTLNSRLQEAEAKAAGAEERERALNERLSQSLSRITVLETQITCLRTEQTQLSRTLEKERQRAAENRQEYLAAMEEAATQEGRAKQLEDEIKEFRNKHKHELQEAAAHRELLEKELERERLARSELEKTASREISILANNDPIAKLSSSYSENGNAPIRKLSSAGSLSSMEESYFLQASLDSSDSFSERRETTVSPYFLKSMTPSAFEAALRQKDGELASYVSRLASLESIRDSLAEELVKMTAQCEKLRAEASPLPSIRAELDALRRRHSSALELMGERDEALEELRADITDLKEMYREQIDLLVNRIQTLSSSAGAA